MSRRRAIMNRSNKMTDFSSSAPLLSISHLQRCGDTPMFDQETWRQRVADRLGGFARNPRQDIQIAGTGSVLAYLAVRTLEPFLEAFQTEPVAAVITLAEITRSAG